ncbi:MAG: hypothetical protein ACK2UX_21755 [Anaerolineae bacterium]|jgi:hypothetical protein
MERKYGALRFVGTVYKVVGIIIAVLTLLAVVGVCLFSVLGGAAMGGIGRELGRNTAFSGFLSSTVGGAIGAFFTILYGGGLALTLYAIGEGIYLLLALEENTRLTAELLQAQKNPMQ